MTPWENQLRAFRFQRPEYIPMYFHVNAASWIQCGKDLERIVLRHPKLFPDFEEGSIDFANMDLAPDARADEPFVDFWGCRWETSQDGIVGCVVKHPLADWSDFEGFAPPDIERSDGRTPIDWDETARNFRQARASKTAQPAGLPHGHTFLLLTYLRGYENLIADMCEERPELGRLIETIEGFNRELLTRYIDLGAEVIGYPEDLGAQTGPMVSPDRFRRYITPSYRRLMALARDAGRLVHFHSDGHIWALMDDILDCGVDIVNLQDLVHGVDEIARRLKGRVCIELDIDRQKVTPYGSPGDIDELVKEEVMKLAAPEGGLCMVVSVR